MDKNRYKTVKIRLPQDPGQAGKDQAENFIKFLSGFSVVTERETGSKGSAGRAVRRAMAAWKCRCCPRSMDRRIPE
jgi:phage terminase large subunit-like protein